MTYVFYPSKVVHYLDNNIISDTRFNSFGIVIEWPQGLIDKAIIEVNMDAELIMRLNSSSYQVVSYPVGIEHVEHIYENTNCYLTKLEKYSINGKVLNNSYSCTFYYHTANSKIDFVAIEVSGWHNECKKNTKEIYQFFL